ncbi:MAG: NUDIX hydrolase [Anaerolineae bacterium]|nr:NUDIX hydrolase [Anaerolineae bacterium]
MPLISKQRIATTFRRFPWAVGMMQRVYRVTQPWMTAGAVGVIFDSGGRVLLVEHVFHALYPWGLPGGWIGRGEDPEDTVRREVLEETGLRIEVLKPLLCTRSRYLPRHMDIAYLCQAPPDLDEASIRLSEELLAYRWLDVLHAPPDIPLIDFHRRALAMGAAEWRAILNPS